MNLKAQLRVDEKVAHMQATLVLHTERLRGIRAMRGSVAVVAVSMRAVLYLLKSIVEKNVMQKYAIITQG